MESRKLLSTVIIASCKTLLIVLALLLLIFCGTRSYEFSKEVFMQEAYTNELSAVTATITVTADYDTKDIAEKLESLGIVNSSSVFYVQARLSDYYKKFVAGTYEVSSAMTPTEILATLSTPVEEETDE